MLWGLRLRKLGEDVTRTLETEPRRWISQAPAPYHVVPGESAGPSLLAMIVFEKFGQHQPLNRQCERYALQGAPIALSTIAQRKLYSERNEVGGLELDRRFLKGTVTASVFTGQH